MVVRSEAKGQFAGWFDRVGTVASSVCAVHCLLTGLAFGMLSTLGIGFMGNPAIDYTFMGIALAMGLLAAWQGWIAHSRWEPMVLLASGLGLLVYAHFGAADRCCPHDGFEHGSMLTLGVVSFPLVPMLSVVGGLCLVAFHVWNQRLRHVGCRRQGAAT